ncbi:MAG: DNA-directed DNA polymerase [Candidatus Nanohaloarchaea archaeon]|nr:DNA-directed DNA polymerase [Candidatus Nanohaloarchaea archaeon]
MVTQTAAVLDADYVIDDGVTVRLFCVTPDGDPLIAEDDTFKPYFYAVPGTGTAEARESVAAVSVDRDDGPLQPGPVTVEQLRDGREQIEVLRVGADEPPQIPTLREAVAELDAVEGTREFDIPFYKRYLIDRGIAPMDWVELEGEERRDGDIPRLLLDREPSPAAGQEYEFTTLGFDLEVYRDEIIMCSFYTDGEELVLVQDVDGIDAGFVETVADEEALLERIRAVVDENDPDLLLGYNTDEYDFDVLRDRAEEHGIELTMGRTAERMQFKRRGRFSGAYLEGRVHLDLYAFVENVVSMGMQSDVLTLDAVAEELIGENTDDLSWEEMQQLWEDREELDRFVRYALRDAELVHELGEALVPQILSLSRLTGLPPFDVCRHTYGQLVENYLLRRAHDRGILAPNRPTQAERSDRYQEGQYAGGFVYEPEEGLHEDIALFDFRSLYPTIIVSHNISPDTLDVPGCGEELTVEIQEQDRVYNFCQDDTGFIPALLEELVEERYGLKADLAEMAEDSQDYRDLDTRQNALKILSNAFYGYMGYNGARWYSRECAEATTALGRKYIQQTIDQAEEMGFEVVYGDTDSVMVKGGDVEDRLDEFQDAVNADLPEFMELEFEGFYPRGLFTYTEEGGGAKKKYALIDRDGNVKITGFEQVRRDWSQIAKEVQKQVIRQVLEGDVDAAVATVEDTIQDLREGAVPLEKLKIYTQMTKKPANYESKAPHIQAARKAIKRGEEIEPGDTIAYVVTRGGGTISDRAELLTYADSYDPAYYVENQVVPVAVRVLKVLGYTEDQLLGKGKQSGLDRFAST